MDDEDLPPMLVEVERLDQATLGETLIRKVPITIVTGALTPDTCEISTILMFVPISNLE
jgi:hypothetical protein